MHWLSSEPERLSRRAHELIRSADELVVAGITWFELGWLAHHGRIVVTVPIQTWLRRLSAEVRTVGITPAVAHTATTLASTFPGDPADRIIFASAVENGWPLVTKDKRILAHPWPREVAVW